MTTVSHVSEPGLCYLCYKMSNFSFLPQVYNARGHVTNLTSDTSMKVLDIQNVSTGGGGLLIYGTFVSQLPENDCQSLTALQSCDIL